MPNYDSLAALLNGPAQANIPIELAGLRGKRLSSMKANRATDPGMIAQLEGDIAEDPYTGDQAQADERKLEDFNTGMDIYNRPDVTERRLADQAAKERLAAAPAKAAGEANANAAKIAAEAKFQALEALLYSGNGNRDVSVAGVGSMKHDTGEAQQQRDTAMAGRQAANNNAILMRQRIQALQTGKASATKTSFFQTQSDANNAEIAKLMQQLGTAGGEMPDVGAESAPAAPAGPSRAQMLIQRYGGR
jgi:hypothetical protein